GCTVPEQGAGLLAMTARVLRCPRFDSRGSARSRTYPVIAWRREVGRSNLVTPAERGRSRSAKRCRSRGHARSRRSSRARRCALQALRDCFVAASPLLAMTAGAWRRSRNDSRGLAPLAQRRPWHCAGLAMADAVLSGARAKAAAWRGAPHRSLSLRGPRERAEAIS